MTEFEDRVEISGDGDASQRFLGALATAWECRRDTFTGSEMNRLVVQTHMSMNGFISSDVLESKRRSSSDKAAVSPWHVDPAPCAAVEVGLWGWREAGRQEHPEVAFPPIRSNSRLMLRRPVDDCEPR